MYKEKKSSWKTTVCGAVSAIGAYFVQLDNPTLQIIGQFLLPIGTLCTGYFAKDSSVED